MRQPLRRYLAYSYRDLSDSDLKHLLAFLQSASGKRYVNAWIASLGAGYDAMGKRCGEQLGESLRELAQAEISQSTLNPPPPLIAAPAPPPEPAKIAGSRTLSAEGNQEGAQQPANRFDLILQAMTRIEHVQRGAMFPRPTDAVVHRYDGIAPAMHDGRGAIDVPRVCCSNPGM